MNGRERGSGPSGDIVEWVYADLERRVRFPPLTINKSDFRLLSNTQLAELRLPARPPPAFDYATKVWERAMTGLRLVEAGSVQEFFGIEVAARHRTVRPAAGSSSANWSGAMQQIPEDCRCRWAMSVWNVPTAQPGAPPASSSGPMQWRVSSWIGLDGSSPGSVTLPQTGTVSFVERGTGNDDPQAEAWWQWWIKDDVLSHPVKMPLVVKPGDTVVAFLTIRTPLLVNFFIANLDTGLGVAFDVAAPALPGQAPEPIEQQTVEWIVERQTEIGGDELLPMANYDACTFEAGGALLACPTGLAWMDLNDPLTLQVVDWKDEAEPGRILSINTGGSATHVGLAYVGDQEDP